MSLARNTALGLAAGGVCVAAWVLIRRAVRHRHALWPLPRRIRTIALDLDHTVARYHPPALYSLVHDCCVDALITDHGYPESLRVPYDASWCAMKGLVLDLETGDFLLLDEYGTVARARHGSLPSGTLDAATIKDRYGGPGKAWRCAEDLTNGKLRDSSYFAFTTGFDIGLSLVCARLVDSVDASAKKEGRAPVYGFMPDVLAGMWKAFGQDAFADGTGGFFSALRAEPAKYIPPRPRVRAWLERLRADGVKLMLVTNSHADFASFTARQALGEGWEGLFDGLVVNARKPQFFGSEAPFRDVTWREGTPTGLAGSRDGEPLAAQDRLPRGQWVAGGSSAALESATNCRGLSVAYVGDHCMGDVRPSRLAGWYSIAVVEELDGGRFLLPAVWGGSFWSAVSMQGVTDLSVPMSWLGLSLRAHSHLIIADVEALADGLGVHWANPMPPRPPAASALLQLGLRRFKSSRRPDGLADSDSSHSRRR